MSYTGQTYGGIPATKNPGKCCGEDRMGVRTEDRIRDCYGHLSVDGACQCPRELAELYRAFAVTCVERQVERVLLKTHGGAPYGYLALRDAFAMMVLAGIPPGFKAAFVGDPSRASPRFQALLQDLDRLKIEARSFADEQQALSWLALGTSRADALEPDATVYAMNDSAFAL